MGVNEGRVSTIVTSLGRKLVLVLLVSASLVIVGAKPGYACTCGFSPNFAETAVASQPVVVGVPVEKKVLKGDGVNSSSDSAVWTFEVEKSINFQAPTELEVLSAMSSASCGLDLKIGERAGIVLSHTPILGDVETEDWYSDLCKQGDPDDLLAAAGSSAIDPSPAIQPPKLTATASVTRPDSDDALSAGAWAGIASVALLSAGTGFWLYRRSLR